MNVRKLLLFLVFSLILFDVRAQELNMQNQARDFVRQSATKWGLTQEDIQNVILTDYYVSAHNQVHHFYFQQTFRGIPIYNAISGIHLMPDGDLVHSTNKFKPEINTKVNTTQPVLDPQLALEKALQQLETPPLKTRLQLLQKDKHTFLFSKGQASQMDIPVQLLFFPDKGQLRLSWQVELYPPGQSNYWSIQIDAQTGSLLDKANLTLSCTFDIKNHDSYPPHQCQETLSQTLPDKNLASPLREQNTPTYHVLPSPIESPIHGERRYLVDPSDPLASPYGWHDTNAVAGPEFFTTKGNNVHAYFDTRANNLPDGDEPIRESLNFDFPYDPLQEPEINKQAALTQLFYMSNFMHDFSYHYGFDERAGNYQNNNYGRGGRDGDAVLTEAMDGSSFNNANFLPLPDGNNSRMQMYLWTRKEAQILKIESPTEIFGSYEAGQASFGPSIDSTEIKGQVVRVNDGSENPSLGCETIINKEEVNGKIALIFRGKCRIVEKVLNAQKAGAKAVIIANYNDSYFRMSGSPAEPINIPSIVVSSSTADRMKGIVSEPIVVRFQVPKENPQILDGSFDNGIIAHEYAHGISTRLTGGPSTTGCLRNDEQMGEGWSDFLSLAVTTASADIEQRTKGVAQFALGGQIQGGGIRRRPYSPFKQFNEFSYKDIIDTGSPHALGEVWATMLWDLYWAFSDSYGWDPDPINGKGGNNMLIQLVMDGMKLQACQPGFIDGRDAILKADSINNNGANQCLIWGVFAERGLGYSATQGDSDNRKDGAEAFDVPPTCLPELKIRKEAINTSISAGEPIRYKIEVRNDKNIPLTGLLINDLLPEGATLIPFSVNGAELAGQNGQQILFRINRIYPGEVIQFQYFIQTDPARGSNRIFFDDFTEPEVNWDTHARSGGRGWRILTDTLRDLAKSWFVPNSRFTNTHLLALNKDIFVSGALPVLRFHHHYTTEPVSDAGFVEISTDAGASWAPVNGEKFLRNGYAGEIDFSTVLLHNQGGFWGNKADQQETILDLSEYVGQQVRIRFQFQSDNDPENNSNVNGIGWTIDDVEIMDLLYYNTDVCISSDQGDFACTKAEELGTTLNSLSTVTTTIEKDWIESIQVKVYPNPARNFLNLQIISRESLDDVLLQIISADGRVVQSSRQAIISGQQQLGFNVSQLPVGMYVLKIQHQQGVISRKLLKR